MLLRSLTRLGALVLLLGILVGFPTLLIALVGNPWPAGGLDELSLMSDSAVLGLISLLGWFVWAQLLLCTLWELPPALRHDPAGASHLPIAWGGQQRLMRILVHSILALGVTTTLLTAHPARAESAQAVPLQPAAHTTLPTGPPTTPTADTTLTAASTTSHIDRAGHPTVLTERGDTLWGLAQTHLGDGFRWHEIADLNHGRAMPDGHTFNNPRSLEPGWTLLLPTDATNLLPEATAGSATEWLVAPGNTLTQIAQETSEDPQKWHDLYETNRKVIGSNPNLILPGQVLKLPGSGATDRHDTPTRKHAGAASNTPSDRQHHGDQPVTQARGPSDARSDARSDDQSDDQSRSEDTPEGRDPGNGNRGTLSTRHQQQQNPHTPHLRATTPPPTAATSAQDDPTPDDVNAPPATNGSLRGETLPAESGAEHGAQRDTADSADDSIRGGATALAALLACAMCLAAGALGLVTANRRRQRRRRGIGRTSASTPDDLAEVEQDIVEHGAQAQADVEFLDRALRHLAACCQATGSPLPQLGAAVLSTEDLTLLFTRPAAGEVPADWTATDDARAWIVQRQACFERDLESQPAPYPALVSIGHDEGGRTWLIDLEALGSCGIGGEPQQVEDLTRFLVAELAVNAWSEGSEVLLADQFGAETVAMNPSRLRQVERSDALALAVLLTSELGEVEQNLGAGILTRRRDGLVLDTTHPVVLVLSSGAAGRPGKLVTGPVGRERSRVVVVHRDQESPAVELAGDGTAFLPRWGIRLTVFTLPAADAEAMAALLTSTRKLEDQPMPPTETDDGPLGKYALADGSLRKEYTAPRHPEGNDPSCLLPAADAVYLATAATTTQDLAATAPNVRGDVLAKIDAIDPALDQDLADWFDQVSPRPKIRLLGPVDLTVRHGGDPAAVANLAGTMSFIAYLACQERGVTGERAADAFGWQTVRTVQNRATDARYLLGRRPDGSDWLPEAGATESARRGAPTYELRVGTGGVLVDFDLFRRVHFRARKRGDDGCERDLVTALSLVAGAPFEASTDRRFPWLFKGQRYDDIMVSAIQTVAHVLATRAVAEGRHDLVMLACDAAHKADPHSDVAWLDLAAATEAESGHAAADELARHHVVDRLDEDLPPRTEAVLDRRDWATG